MSRAVAAMQRDAAAQRKETHERYERVTARQDSIEASLQSARETLDPARLNRSTRSQALQLLRAGRPAGEAAAALGIARREAVLLSKVAGLLASAG
ncbi:MAG: hypothetical protein KGN84_14195 [Acidobacteriota bacterium]|nr:hypothetical protein [Acidobacteriota bacterium]